MESVENLNRNIFKNKKNIILDMDGTLIDSIGIWNEVDIDMIKQMGKEPGNVGLDRDLFLASNTKGDIYINYADFLLKHYHIKEYTPEEWHNKRCDLAEIYHMEKLKLKKKAEYFLRVARAFGYTLTLATISTPRFVEIYANRNFNIYSKMNLYAMFNGGILTKEDVQHKKPNPEVYLKVLDKHNCGPEECIVIEDSLSGVQAAKTAGIETINIYDKYSDIDREEISKIAEYYARNYKVLTLNIKK